MSRQHSTARAWLLAFVPAVVIIGLMAWGFLALESLGTPRTDATGDPTEFVLQPDPPPPRTPDPTPTPTPDLGAEPFLVDVEPIENMHRAPDSPSLDFYLLENGALVDSTYLGARDVWHAFGLLSDQGDVCMWVTVADPVANPGLPGTGECTTYPVFMQYGVSTSHSGWDVHWSADGTVQWVY